MTTLKQHAHKLTVMAAVLLAAVAIGACGSSKPSACANAYNQGIIDGQNFVTQFTPDISQAQKDEYIRQSGELSLQLCVAGQKIKSMKPPKPAPSQPVQSGQATDSPDCSPGYVPVDPRCTVVPPSEGVIGQGPLS